MNLKEAEKKEANHLILYDGIFICRPKSATVIDLSIFHDSIVISYIQNFKLVNLLTFE